MVLEFRGGPLRTDSADGDMSDDDVYLNYDVNIIFDDLDNDHDQFDDIIDADDDDSSDEDFSPSGWTDDDVDIDEAGPPVDYNQLFRNLDGRESDDDVEEWNACYDEDGEEEMDERSDEEPETPDEPNVDTNETT